MGQPPVGLTLDEIAVFESLGMTNEWLAGPLCISAFLVEAAATRPEVVRGTLGEMLAAIRESGLAVPRPDFAALARELVSASPEAAHEPAPILAMLSERSATLRPVLAELLGDIRPPVGPVANIIQHYTLGDQQFEDTYGVSPVITTDSYLTAFDRPGLSAETSARLLGLLRNGNNCGAAIFTARPSLPPRGLFPAELFELARADFAPEAELAVEALRFDGTIPLIAEGRMLWLEAQNGRPRGAYIKPSPVHALACIGAARSGEEKTALLAAAALAEHHTLTGPLAGLAGDQTRVIVFEDSTGGLSATTSAVDMLRSHGIEIVYEAVGVATEASKREALSRAADRVAASLDEALEPYL